MVNVSSLLPSLEAGMLIKMSAAVQYGVKRILKMGKERGGQGEGEEEREEN